MQNVLIATTSETRDPLFRALGVDYDVAVVDLNCPTADLTERLHAAFDGKPPAAVVVDLRSSPDCLPLRHVRRILQLTWFEDGPLPVCLGLLSEAHLAQPDWPAYVDDFALPPYNVAELRARLRRLMFARRHVQADDTARLNGLTIDFSARRAVDQDGTVLPLTPREFDLLAFLVQHRGRFFPRERLLDLVWGIDFDGGWRTVDIHVRRLRAKLPAAVGDLIETRRGLGYGLQTR